MDKIAFQPFQSSHMIGGFQGRVTDVPVPGMGGGVREYAFALERALGAGGRAWTGLLGNRPIASGGLVPIFAHSMEAWVVVYDVLGFRSHRLSFHRRVRAEIAEAMAHGVHRIQSFVIDSPQADQHKAWLVSLGFSSEGVCNRFGPNGEDYWRYAKWHPR